MKKSPAGAISDSTIKRTQRLLENLKLGSLFLCILLIATMQPIHAHNNHSDNRGTVTLFLSGDVMTGRGIDQILPHPCKPVIYEPYMKSARGYVEIAERENGPIPEPVDFSYIWGDALEVLEQRNPDIRLINLETSITDSDTYWKGKQIHYRMHPENAPCLTAAKIDICVLANNHVLDWGYEGLKETVQTLSRRNIQVTGAGENISKDDEPVIYNIEFPNGANQ